MRSLVAAVVLLVVVGMPRGAAADTATELRAANERLQQGEYGESAKLAGRVARAPQLMDRADRSEAWRIYGLSLFLLGLTQEADVALFEYLKLDWDAQLDPALVPPEAVAFLAEVRMRHKQELREYRPRPRVRRRAWLNLLPPAGQFQNGESGKAWAIGGLGLSLLAVNLSTGLVLNDWCNSRDGTCGEDRAATARTLRTVNHLSVVAFAAVYAYGVWDGYRGLGQLTRHERRSQRQFVYGVTAAPGGPMVFMGGAF